MEPAPRRNGWRGPLSAVDPLLLRICEALIKIRRLVLAASIGHAEMSLQGLKAVIQMPQRQ
jgi:hypothetical protein